MCNGSSCSVRCPGKNTTRTPKTWGWVGGGGGKREQAGGLPRIPGLPEGSSIYALYTYIVAAFAVGAPKLYLHMIRQRKKQLGAGGGKTKAS